MSSHEDHAVATAAPRLATSEAARREAQRFLKFLVVGGIGFVVDTGSLSVFVFVFAMNRVVAKGLAFSLAVVCNFILNRLWTYPDSRSKRVLTQVAQFALVSVVGLGINLLVFGWADSVASRIWGSLYGLYLAQAAAVGVALFWNYAANRIITYGDVSLGR